MTDQQVANFSYWMLEHTDNRGADRFSGKEKIAFIQNILIPKFLKAYPDGILSGWANEPKKKRKIGIDLDTTLVMLNVVSRAAKELGYTFDETDTHTWNQSQFPDDLRNRIFELFVDDEHMNSCDPIPGSSDKLAEWSDAGHEIYIITARAAEIRDNTLKLVQRHYPNVNGIYFVDHNQTKIHIMKSLGVDVWIDDAPHGVEESMEHGFETYLISNKYTKYNWPARDIPGINVVKHVGEIIL